MIYGRKMLYDIYKSLKCYFNTSLGKMENDTAEATRSGLLLSDTYLSRSSSVNIVTRLRAGRPGFYSRQG